MGNGKLIKVIFEYENITSVLEGEEMCEAWLLDINGSLQVEQIRSGYPRSGIENAKWKKYTKKDIRKKKLDQLNPRK